MNTMLRLSESAVKCNQEILKKPGAGRIVLRAVISLLLHHLPVKEIAKILGLSASMLYNRANRYKMDGSASFADKARSGRPAKMNPEAKALLQTLLDRDNYRTLHTLSLQLKEQGFHFSRETIRKAIHELLFRWNRPRQGPPPCDDPLKEEKLAKIEIIKASLKQDEHLLYLDEADFNTLSPVRNTWQKKGQQRVISTPGKNEKVFVFGCIEPSNGKFVYQVTLRKRSYEFLCFLKHIVRSFAGKIYIILDNYSIHKTAAIQKFCQSQAERLELLFLPTYYPQGNQPIERSWGTCKTRINANQVFSDRSVLVRAVRTGLRQFQYFVLKPEAS